MKYSKKSNQTPKKSFLRRFDTYSKCPVCKGTKKTYLGRGKDISKIHFTINGHCKNCKTTVSSRDLHFLLIFLSIFFIGLPALLFILYLNKQTSALIPFLIIISLFIILIGIISYFLRLLILLIIHKSGVWEKQINQLMLKDNKKKSLSILSRLFDRFHRVIITAIFILLFLIFFYLIFPIKIFNWNPLIYDILSGLFTLLMFIIGYLLYYYYKFRRDLWEKKKFKIISIEDEL